MVLISMRVVPLGLPPLARVDFLAFDNDRLLEIFVKQILPAMETNFRSIDPIYLH